MQKENEKFNVSDIMEGMPSISAVIKAIKSNATNRKIISIFIDKEKKQSKKKEDSAKYAFLLFVPAMLGATALELTNLASLFDDTSKIHLYLISFIITFVTTYFAFAVLKKIISKGKITYFGIYCAILGIITFVYAILVK